MSIVDNAGAWTPNNTALPTVSGSLGLGQTLTATPGSWTGAPQTFEYSVAAVGDAGRRLQPDPGRGRPRDVIHVTSADLGHTFRVEVVATNALGTSLPAYSS